MNISLHTEGKGVEDAIATVLHNLFQHLDGTGMYVKVLFVDFSSAVYTIQPHLLIQKLDRLGVDPNLILWINSYLTERIRFVKLNEKYSKKITTYTGAPQGCVISPFLFTFIQMTINHQLRTVN